jgi:hypothetical protein
MSETTNNSASIERRYFAGTFFIVGRLSLVLDLAALAVNGFVFFC